jgi:hypothetical protein
VTGLVLVGILGAALVAGLVLFFSRQNRNRLSIGDVSDVRTRIGDDGFFVVGDFEPGAQVQYEALIQGGWRRGLAPIVGGETFVYTGTPPTDVRIVGIEGGMLRRSIPPSSGPASVDDAFTGFPGAY